MRVFRGCCMGVGSSPRMEGYAPRQARNLSVGCRTHRWLPGLTPSCCADVAAGFRPKTARRQQPLESRKPLGPKASRLHGRGYMYYVPLFREVLYIRYGTPLPLRESASTTIRGYRFPAEHRNRGTRPLSERAAKPRERPGRQQRAAPPCPPPTAEQTNTNTTDKRSLHIQQAHHRPALMNDAG
jgi:hypothetical protein